MQSLWICFDKDYAYTELLLSAKAAYEVIWREDLVVEETVEQRNEESLERDDELCEVRPDGEAEPRACGWVDDGEEVVCTEQWQQ